MRYEYAPDLQAIAEDVCNELFPHVKLHRMKCFRSYGSSSRYTIARCHAMGKLMQQALGCDAFYPIEFLHEQFDKLSEEEQLKTIIHELMHIPKTFGGGFRQHDYVNDKNVNKMHKEYLRRKRARQKTDWFGLDSLRRQISSHASFVSSAEKKLYSSDTVLPPEIPSTSEEE